MLFEEPANRKGLITIKEDLSIAKRGKDVLEDKVESLTKLFFEYIKLRRQKRTEIEKEIEKAFKDLILAESFMGLVLVKSHALISETGNLETSEKNIMGIKTLKFSWTPPKEVKRFSSIKLDETKRKFKILLEKIIEVGELEGIIKNFASEIDLTMKKINNLDNFIIPELEKTKKWIKLRIEQNEKEDILRYKIIKKKLRG